MYGETAEVVVFSPNRGGAVVEHCRKYTVGYDAWRDSRPGHHPWPCGDRAGVLAAPAGPCGEYRPALDVAALRGSCRRGSSLGQGRGSFREPCPCRSKVLRRGKYKGSTGIWQHSSWSSAEHVSHSVAASHSVATVPGVA